MSTPPLPRLRFWALIGLAVVGFARPAGMLAAPADSEPAVADVAPAPAVAEAPAPAADPVAPEGHPIIPIHYPRFPIIHPGFPIIIIPIYPYPHPCGPAGVVYPPPPPGLPTPIGTPAARPPLLPLPSPTPGGRAQSEQYRVCPQVKGLVPQDVQDLATGEPWRFNGYGELRNPGIPYHPLWNTYRTWLSLRDTAQPYSVCNLPLWKSGCP